MLKVGSDFSGVGAFDQALIRLGIEFKTVFACDNDKYARDTYVLNYGAPECFPNDVYDREIIKEPLDIYMSSPPCQAFSLAGNRKGENDKRGILFYNSHEFIKKNGPRYFIFENVKGLLSDNKGKTFGKWISLLGGKSVNGVTVFFPHEESVPYHIYYHLLNAKHYGIPQNRERLFIIGIRDDSDNNFCFPKPLQLKKSMKDVLEKNVHDKYFLSNKMINGFMNHKNRHQKKGNGFKFEVNDINKHAKAIACKAGSRPTDNYICVEPKTGAISGQNIDNQKSKIRRLTPRECFRFMDFPESFKWDVSNSQAYKQAGNSICVGMLVEIIKKLKL